MSTVKHGMNYLLTESQRNPSHTSFSDSKPHATIALATEDQAKKEKCQVAHLYHDNDHNYTGHTLYKEQDYKNKKGKKKEQKKEKKTKSDS